MKDAGSYGNVMRTTCPLSTFETEIQTLCETADNTDFLRGMPVVDERAGIVYRNVFCARCNAVQNVSYWRMSADCGRIPASALPQDNALLLAFVKENCTVKYHPTDDQRKYLKNCVATESNCSSKQIVNKEPVVQELCSYYSFPVCGDVDRKNPHCALYNGEDITKVNCICFPPEKATSAKSTTLPRTKAGEPTTPRTRSKSTTLSHTYFPPGTSSAPGYHCIPWDCHSTTGHDTWDSSSIVFHVIWDNISTNDETFHRSSGTSMVAYYDDSTPSSSSFSSTTHFV